MLGPHLSPASELKDRKFCGNIRGVVAIEGKLGWIETHASLFLLNGTLQKQQTDRQTDRELPAAPPTPQRSFGADVRRSERMLVSCFLFRHEPDHGYVISAYC